MTQDIESPHVGMDLAWTLLESLPYGVIATSVTGDTRYINPAASQLLGCALHEVRGRPLNEFLQILDGKTRAPVNSPLSYLLARDAEVSHGDYDFLMPRNGREIPIEHYTAIFRNPAGTTIGLLLMLQDASRTRDIMRRLTVQATHDGLTRLVNRTEFERRLAQMLAGMHAGEQHALLYMDLDGFKGVNDNHGHAAGDAVLREVAGLFRALVRNRDMIARLGGDEFGLLLEHCPLDNARRLAEQFSQTLADHTFHWEDRALHLGVSIGVLPITEPGRDPREVLMAADEACYAAKRENTKR